ncbi:MAG: glycosyltransferase [Gemmatimonadetes bacterium]|nr:glycosyltransferase [Gemmatimonadota bacterium]
MGKFQLPDTPQIYHADQTQNFRKRVAFYSQHLIGVGHHFRNRQIVNELVKTCDVFFIDGGRPIPEADLDERVVRISLPPLRAGAQGIESVDKERDLQAVMRERQVRLSEAMEQIRPDVFCVEFFPFSRWSLKSEILNTIVRLNEINPGAKVLCSLRDIPTRAKSDELQLTFPLTQRRDGDAMRFYSVPFGGIHHEYLSFNRRYYEEVVPVLNQYFDAVLVHGDSQLSRLEDHFPWTADIGIPVVYTGFVSEKLEDASRPDGAPNRYVLVSAGGGAEGLALVAPCIEAWKQLDQDAAHDGREMVIFAGAFIDETHFEALRELCGDSPFRIERFTSNFLAWIKHADLSISRAGYNTCMNVLETQVPSILVPSIAMDDQEFRAQQLMGLGISGVIHPDQLSVAKMAKAIAGMLESSVPEHHLSLDGAAQTRKFIESV